MKNILFLFGLVILITSCNTPISKQHIIYLGNRSDNPEQGIQVAYFNSTTGEISTLKKVANISQPNFIALDEDKGFVYSVGKDLENNDPIVASFKIKEDPFHLEPVSKVSANGMGPCFVSYSHNNNLVATANYVSGNICIFNSNNGKLSFSKSFKHYGNGPNKKRQEKPHAHSIFFDPSQKFGYAADLGTDKIMIYSFNNNSYSIIDSIISAPGAGPRHLDFSPDKELLAVVNELSSTVSTYKKQGELYKEHLQTITMIPDTFSGFTKAADIHFSPDGKFLYASNRGFNSIAIYKVKNRKLEFIGWETEGINWPRNFAIDPSGHFLLVANKNANSITIYKRDLNSGLLTKTKHELSIESPVCIRFSSKKSEISSLK